MIEKAAEASFEKLTFNLAMIFFTSQVAALCSVFIHFLRIVLLLSRLNVVAGVAGKVLLKTVKKMLKSVKSLTSVLMV